MFHRFLVALIILSSTIAKGQVLSSTIIQELDSIAGQYITENSPGLAIGIVKEGKRSI